MKIWKSGTVPVKSWCEELEDGAKEQLDHVSALPFAYHHVAVMPDAHQGYGVPIGCVLATDGYVIPNAVGVDIGCGMVALSTGILTDHITRENVQDIIGLIRTTIPVGFAHREEACNFNLMPQPVTLPIVIGEFEKARHQLGTLGGGNHFIELQRSDSGQLWVMIHSGSRNLGKQVADHYNKLAVGLNAKWHTKVWPDWDLAFLPLDSDEGRAYMREMQYCVEFAKANRMRMLEFVVEAIERVLNVDISTDDNINIAHNYAAAETHFGKTVMVHRKGATRAHKDVLGIIPGSMGTASYIVRGLGNPESFMSCSHGAGRKMGRGQAKRNLDLAEQQAILNNQGIVHDLSSVDALDEAPGAYKDIDDVMAAQADLVEVVVKLTTLAVVKG